MRYELSCAVESQTYLATGNHSFERCDKTYTFIASPDGLLSEIAISAKVSDPGKFKMRFVSNGFLEEYDGELRDEIIADFQYLESVLGFVGEVSRIRWDAPRRRVIPETEHEGKDIISASLYIEPKWKISPDRLSNGALEAIIDDRQIIQPVELLYAFFREGKNELYQFRFINAFYNLFFVLEGLYGKGQHKVKELKTAFWSYTEFREAAIASWNRLVLQDEELSRKVLTEAGCNVEDSTDDQLILTVVDWVIDKRGPTHHFFLRSSQKQGTPLNQRDYEHVACVTFLLAETAINNEVTRLHASQPKAEDS